MKQKKPSLLSQLFAFAGGYKKLTMLGIVLSGISAALSVLPILFVWFGVDEVLKMQGNYGDTGVVINYAIIATVTAILSITIYVFSLMLTHKAAFRIAKNMKTKALSHMMDLPLGFFSDSRSGALRRTVTDSAARTEAYLAHQLPDMAGAFVMPVVVLVLLFVFDWRLGLISLIPLALSLIAMSSMMMNKDYPVKIKEYQTSLEKINSEGVEYVRGIPVVKTFGQSVHSFKRFYSALLSYKDYVMKYTVSMRVPMTLFQTFLGSSTIILVIGGALILSGSTDPATFISHFLFYIFFAPIMSFMMFKIIFMSQNTMVAEDAVSRVKDLLAEKPLEYIKNEKFPQEYNISLEDVTFRYPGAKENAIEDMSLKVKSGEQIALVGPSGGGKSTIAMLMARFWDVDGGSVNVGGVNVKDIAEDELMSNISFVFQSTNLYKCSIMDNVRESKPNATEKEVLAALHAARCDEIVSKFGLHAKVGTGGVFLSGGEAQRIAIARAILKDAPIILLDEATAFTDPENEHEIQLALSELAKGKTVVMIAHRLSTVQHVDRIYLVEEGKIAEQGSHDELVARGGKYAEMWSEYNKAFVWKDEVSA